MWPKSYAQRLHRVAERLDAVDRTRLATSLGMVEYAQCGTGPPLLVSHGIFGGFDAALHHADTYVGDGFGVIAPSRFGYLGSTISADATVSGQADAYAALLDHLGVDRAALFAFSAGSVSALRFALRYPDRTAALVITSGHYPQRHHKVPASLLGPSTTIGCSGL